MFDFISKSKARQSILQLLFTNTDKKFYLRELARIIKSDPANVSRELKKLEKEKLIVSEKRGNLKFFKVNITHPLFPEIQKIIQKTIGIEAVVKKSIQNIQNIQFAFIFGSYVKGDFNADSDIDIFIIGQPEEDIIFQKFEKLETKFNRQINYHIANIEEFLSNFKEQHFLQEITKKCILLTENENEFRKFIEGAKK